MLARNGAGPNPCGDKGEAGKVLGAGKHRTFKPTTKNPQAWSLQWRSRRLVCVVPDDDGGPLYRVIWPDIAPSPSANLARCMEAAERWAEQQIATDLKKRGGGALKFHNIFSWSASPMRYFREGDALPIEGKINERGAFL